jgi:hypothetical protein
MAATVDRPACGEAGRGSRQERGGVSKHGQTGARLTGEGIDRCNKYRKIAAAHRAETHGKLKSTSWGRGWVTLDAQEGGDMPVFVINAQFFMW